MTRTIATLLAVCSLVAAGAASAEINPNQSSGEVTARISYSDLDLATVSGAATFDARVDTAARQFCRQGRLPGKQLTNRMACRSAVREEVMQQLPETVQTQYALGRREVSV